MLLTALGGMVARVPPAAWIVAGLVAVAAAWIGLERDAAAGWRQAAATAEARAGVLRGQVDGLAAINEANAAELGRIRLAHDRAIADISADLARARKAGTRLTIVRQEIALDPEAATPMADRCPAFDRLLDRMLDHRDGTADRDEGRAGGDPASGRPAGMPAGAGGAAGPANGG